MDPVRMTYVLGMDFRGKTGETTIKNRKIRPIKISHSKNFSSSLILGI